MALITGEAKLRRVIARRMRRAMARFPMKQADLARGTGLTPTGISHILNERRTPDLTSLEVIAETLGVSVSWLMGKEKE